MSQIIEVTATYDKEGTALSLQPGIWWNTILPRVLT